MGHSNKNMIDEVYGRYRQGLIEERGEIIDYLGEGFLSLEELKVSFPERYRKRMLEEQMPKTDKAPVYSATFSQSFGQMPKAFYR